MLYFQKVEADMKRSVAYITDPVYLEHDTGPWHPESPERLRAVEKALTPLKERLVTLSPIRISETLLETVHTPEHIETVRWHCDALEPIDADTVCSKGSWNAALMAAGAGIVALDAIEKERFPGPSAPSGHRATTPPSNGRWAFASSTTSP